ncbi:MAG: DNA mismatch repair endonuclease MutL, partial [Chthonomonadales bacterium]
MRIHLLDDNTANRIAAGEVVERPASAVKELVENSIDAGATRIVIRLQEGGKRRIEVADNGNGMGEEDAVLSLQRHATSKITSSDDLFAIRTLGFRGEALPSIASVSRFTLITSEAGNEGGTRVLVEGGDILSVEPFGAQQGTTIVVEDLFFNTPARLKFLKSTTAELSRVIDAVGQLAIVHPEIAFTVFEGESKRLQTPGGGEPIGPFATVWGREIARRLLPIAGEDAGIQVGGYLCTPELTRPGRSHELFYVNDRPVKSRLLGHALEDAVRSLTPDSRYPIGAIFIQIAPDQVDVNVHPTKLEVKFTQDGAVHHAVSQAVKRTLMEHGIVPTMGLHVRSGMGSASLGVDGGRSAFYSSPDQPPLFVREVGYGASGLMMRDFDAVSRAAYDAFRPLEGVSTLPREEVVATANITSGIGGIESLEGFAPIGLPEKPKPFGEQLRGFQVLGQLRNTYILAQTEDGIAIIDQHVAHERVLYERLSEARKQVGTAAQRLAIPFNLELGAAEASMVRERMEDFQAAGWELESFGRDAFLVRSIPVYSARKNPEALLRDIVDELAY